MEGKEVMKRLESKINPKPTKPKTPSAKTPPAKKKTAPPKK